MLFDKTPTTSSSFAFSKTLFDNLEKDKFALNQYKTAVQSGMAPTQAFDTYMREASSSAQEYAQSVNAASISNNKFKTYLRQTDITTQAQNKSFSNCKVLIDEYSTGMKKCKLEHGEYIDAIKKSNPQLAKYLTNLNGAKGSIGGYIVQLTGAKVATFALQAATMALNMALTMGISMLVSGLISAIGEAIVTEKELSNKVEEVTSKWKEQFKTLRDGKKEYTELAKEYADLSKGVNDLGGNVSLTVDEYERYKEVVNQLAEQNPNLVKGWTSEGVAILSVKDNVQELIDKYDELIKKENDALIGDGKNIFDDFANKKKDIANSNNGRTIDIYSAQALKDLLNSSDIEKAYEKYNPLNEVDDNHFTTGAEILNSFFAAGLTQLENESAKDFIVRQIKENRDIVESILSNFEIQLGVASSKMVSLAEAYLSNAFLSGDYSNLSDSMQSVINSVISNLDFDYFSELDDPTEMYGHIKTLLLEFNSMSIEDRTAFEVYFNLKTKVDNNECTIGEYMDNVLDIQNIISKLPKELQPFVNIVFGFDTNGIADKIRDLKTRLTFAGVKRDIVSNFIDSLNNEDLEKALGLWSADSDLSGYTEERLRAILDAHKTVVDEINKTSFSGAMSSVEKLSESFDMLNKIYTDVKDGKDFDYSSILNNDDFKKAFSALPSYEKFIETIANSPDDISKCQSAFNSLVGEYIDGSKVLDGLTDETRDATIAFLRQNGVVNAAEIVNRKLAVQKEKLALEAGKLKNATEKEIIAELKMAEAGSVAQQALFELALAKIKLKDNPIDTSKEVDEIINIAKAANISTSAIATLSRVKKIISEVEKDSRLGSVYLNNGAYENALEIAEKIRNGTFDFGTYNFEFDEGITGKNANKAFDWIEVAINRVKENIDTLKDKAANTFDSFTNRATATKDAISAITNEIGLQNKAYEKYMSKANSVNLSEELKQKVRTGDIDINEYNSDTSDKIKEYQDYYEKALEAKQATKDLHDEIASLYEENFDRIATEYESVLGQIESEANSIEISMDKAEVNGLMASTKYYGALAKTEKETLSTLKNERADLISALNAAIDSGAIEMYDEAWYKLQGEIDEVTESINESGKALSEYDNEMRQIAWDRFDYLLDTMSQINDEADFLIELLGDNLYDDSGNLNENGMAVMGLHGANYNLYMERAISYAKELEKINQEIANNPNDTKLIARKNELLELQRESISAAEEEKNAMIDMVSEGIDLQLDAFQALIDKYEEALDSAKNLYDYQKKVSEQTKNIASIEKQLSAYANDDSEETKAKVQQLKIDLEEAQSDLEETQYDKYIDDQKELLDDLYNSYEKTLNSRLDDVNGLITDVICAINKYDGIETTLTDAVSQVGTTLSSSMEDIWGADGNKLKVYDENNTSAIAGIGLDLDGYFSAYYPNSETGLQSALSGIVSDINSLLTYASGNADGEHGNNDGTNNSGGGNGGNTSSQPPKNTPTTQNTISVGSKINAQGAMIYDYAGDTSGEYQYFGKDPIYTVIDEKDGYLRVRHHSLSSGSSGWFKKSDVKAYKTGGLVDYTGLAQVDGTPGKPELMLNSTDTENFLELRDLLRAMSKQSLSIGSSWGSNFVPTLTGLSDISGKLASMRVPSGKTQTTIGDIKINIPIEHVDDYNDFISQLQKDKQFEKFVRSVSVDLLSGGSTLAKNKYKW